MWNAHEVIHMVSFTLSNSAVSFISVILHWII